jgi:hypothetical protein
MSYSIGNGSFFLHGVRLCHYYKIWTSYHNLGHQFIIKSDPALLRKNRTVPILFFNVLDLSWKNIYFGVDSEMN